jgi:hypothetical protein
MKIALAAANFHSFRVARQGPWITSVNKGIKKGIGARSDSPDSPTHLGYYPHFFNPPGDVSLFCPAGHLPEEVVFGLPFPFPSSIAANATLPNDIVSAITTAAINNVMRFFIFSPAFPFLKNETGQPLFTVRR